MHASSFVVSLGKALNGVTSIPLSG